MAEILSAPPEHQVAKGEDIPQPLVWEETGHLNSIKGQGK
jgi:hypothetical protein